MGYRSFHEPRDPFDFFDQQAEDDRRHRIEEAKKHNAVRDAQEAEADAKRRESSRVFTLETNERLRLAEYRYHGVEPPIIDGVRTKSSFHMLMSLGWTIEESLDQRWMVKPAPSTQVRRSREDYDGNT